jgi:hypothetical protein
MLMPLTLAAEAGVGYWSQDPEFRSQVYVIGVADSVFTVYFSQRESICVPTGVVGYVGNQHMVGDKFDNENSILFVVDGRRFFVPITQFNPGPEVFIDPSLLGALKNGKQVTIRGAAGGRTYQVRFSLRDSHHALSAAQAFCNQQRR